MKSFASHRICDRPGCDIHRHYIVLSFPNAASRDGWVAAEPEVRAAVRHNRSIVHESREFNTARRSLHSPVERVVTDLMSGVDTLITVFLKHPEERIIHKRTASGRFSDEVLHHLLVTNPPAEIYDGLCGDWMTTYGDTGGRGRIDLPPLPIELMILDHHCASCTEAGHEPRFRHGWGFRIKR